MKNFKIKKVALAALVLIPMLAGSCKKDSNDSGSAADPKITKILYSHKWQDIWQDMPHDMPDTSFISRDSFENTIMRNYMLTFYQDGTYSRWFGSNPATFDDSGTWWADNKVIHVEALYKGTYYKNNWDIVSLNDDSLLLSGPYQDTFLTSLYLAR